MEKKVKNVYHDKNYVKKKESDTYLAADKRHRRSMQIAIKVDKCVAFSRHCGLHQPLSSRSAYYGDVFCQLPDNPISSSCNVPHVFNFCCFYVCDESDCPCLTAV